MLNTIVVPLDGSRLSERALPVAAALAQSSQARLILVRAARGDSDAAQFDAIQEAQDYLEVIARQLSWQGAPVEVSVLTEAPADAILDVAELHQADLIVMSTHGRSGLRRWVYGSVAEAVLNHSHVPVWLVRAEGNVLPDSHGAERRLLAPLDGSPFSEAALPMAAALARALGFTLVLLRVVVPPALPVVEPSLVSPDLFSTRLNAEEAEAQAYLTALADGLNREGLVVRTVVRTGLAARAILDEMQASSVSLVVMATHGRTGLGRMVYGSIAAEVLHHCAKPLLLVRPTSLKVYSSASRASLSMSEA